jgi:hypothetical protein
VKAHVEGTATKICKALGGMTKNPSIDEQRITDLVNLYGFRTVKRHQVGPVIIILLDLLTVAMSSQTLLTVLVTSDFDVKSEMGYVS